MKTIKEAIELTNRLLDDIIFMCEARTKSTYFTRSGKMKFKSIILFMLNFIKKSIQIELDDFFKKIINKQNAAITKQGYSEARQKISPKAFIKMADNITNWYYGDDNFKKFRGYRLCAIDGTVLEINNSERLREAFGYVENKSMKVARALASAIFDIENDMILTAKITKYTTSERDLAVDLIEQLKSIGLKNDLILFDRGYPSTKLISYLDSNKIQYLMRVSSMFLKEVNDARKEDQVIKINVDGKSIKIRVLKFMLDSGIEEVLITSLQDKDLGINEFKELYFKRWDIEVKFNELKNKLQIENFTGDTPVAVEQDFYAAMYLTNMVAIAKAEATQKIQEKGEVKELKYQYKVNTNILIGKLKDSLVLMLMEANQRKRSKMLSKIMQEISRNSIPIRPGRSNKRKASFRAYKYPLNQKKGL